MKVKFPEYFRYTILRLLRSVPEQTDTVKAAIVKLESEILQLNRQ